MISSVLFHHLMWLREKEMRILIVEDELDLANALARGLRQKGYAVDIAVNGEWVTGRPTAMTPPTHIHQQRSCEVELGEARK